jgi:hypothetical protein
MNSYREQLTFQSGVKYSVKCPQNLSVQYKNQPILPISPDSFNNDTRITDPCTIDIPQIYIPDYYKDITFNGDFKNNKNDKYYAERK